MADSPNSDENSSAAGWLIKNEPIHELILMSDDVKIRAKASTLAYAWMRANGFSAGDVEVYVLVRSEMERFVIRADDPCGTRDDVRRNSLEASIRARLAEREAQSKGGIPNMPATTAEILKAAQAKRAAELEAFEREFMGDRTMKDIQTETKQALKLLEAKTTTLLTALKIELKESMPELLSQLGAQVARMCQETVASLEAQVAELKIPAKVTLKIGEGAKDVKVPDTAHEIFPNVLASVGAGLNTLMVGPAGCGKTTIAKQVAEALHKPFSYTGAVSNEFKLLGFKNAQGEYVPTTFYKEFTEGHVFCFDEMDGSDANALLMLNQALANRQLDFPCGCIDAHPDFAVIGCANTYGHGASRQYVGRNQLDAASLDRFTFFPMDYDEKLERALSTSKAWLGHVWAVRKRARDNSLRHIVSTRAIIHGEALLRTGMHHEVVSQAVLYRDADPAQVAILRGPKTAPGTPSPSSPRSFTIPVPDHRHSFTKPPKENSLPRFKNDEDHEFYDRHQS
jgi:cobaltochelatase CobS